MLRNAGDIYQLERVMPSLHSWSDTISAIDRPEILLFWVLLVTCVILFSCSLCALKVHSGGATMLVIGQASTDRCSPVSATLQYKHVSALACGASSSPLWCAGCSLGELSSSAR